MRLAFWPVGLCKLVRLSFIGAVDHLKEHEFHLRPTELAMFVRNSEQLQSKFCVDQVRVVAGVVDFNSRHSIRS